MTSDDERRARVEKSYDEVSHAYATHFWDELRHKPLDRALLDAFAEMIGGRGTVADLGCGPGHVARYLHDRGVSMVGVDISAEMVSRARERTPGVDFRVGSILALDTEADGWAGAVAFYAIVNLTPEEVRTAFHEMHRVLRPGGLLLLSFHIGDERIHRDELLGVKVDLEFLFFTMAFVANELVGAGFTIEARLDRAPYETEHPSHRGYVLARKAPPA